MRYSEIVEKREKQDKMLKTASIASLSALVAGLAVAVKMWLQLTKKT